MATRRTAIVTGGNRGLGLEIARQLLAHDVFVVIGARDPVKGAEAVRSLGGESADVATFVLDVNDTRSCQRFAEHVVKKHGAPGILVNNAGVYPESTDAHVVDTPTSVWRETFEVNALAPLVMAEAFVPHIARSADKKLVAVSSQLGSITNNNGGMYAYRASKTALNMEWRSLSLDTAGRGLICIVLHPGWVQTDMGGPGAPVSIEQSITGVRRELSHRRPS